MNAMNAHGLYSMDAIATLRAMASRPAFTALTVAALGLGIGLNTAIFSLVHRALLESLPYEEPERLVRVWESRPRMGRDSADVAAFSVEHFRAWREANDVFEAMAIYQDASFNLTGGAEPLRVEGQRVSPALFPMLGVPPALGRTFTADEETPGRDRVVLLGHGLWQRLFGGDETVLGRRLALDAESYTVVGVMPPEFRFPTPSTELWVPLPASPLPEAEPGELRVELVPVIAKLKSGVSLERAEAAGRSFLAHYRRSGTAVAELDEGVNVHLTSLHEQLVRPIRPALLVLLGAVSLVLLVICANVANLFLARAERRETELAIRSALGAARSRLFGQLLIESLLYAVAGGAFGILVAYLSLRAFPLLHVEALPLQDDVRLSRAVLAFNVGASIVTAVLVGVLPALRASRTDAARGLKAGTASLTRSSRSRHVVAVAEVALAMMLFVSAMLLVRSFLALTRTDPGYEPDNVLTFRLSLPAAKYESADSKRAFYDALRERLSALPGVTAAGLANSLPLEQGRMITTLAVEGRAPVTDPTELPRASLRFVSPGFFEAMGIPLLEGPSSRGVRSRRRAAGARRQRGTLATGLSG